MLILIGIVQPFIGLLTHASCNLIMNHIYAAKYPYFEKYRILQQPWPWEIDKEAYNKQYRKLAITTAIGSGIFGPLLLYPLAYYNIVQYDSDPSLFPSSLEFFKQHVFMMITYDFSFYWLHRLFHTPWLYKMFHKQHHEYHMTVAIATIDNHPLDYLITGFVPAFSGQLLLGRIHVFTALMFHIFVVVFGIITHTGYNLPWHPWGVFPFGVNIDFHDFHHSHNVGNYGVYSTFWDIFGSTSRHYYKSIAEKEKSN